ncbi:MAG: type I CRISPR-associated protein Cas7 [Mariniphaga sp.]
MNYSKRIFGAAMVKAINANYNADFSGQPRTLPNGVVYATDKALKYTIKNFIKEFFTAEYVFYFKRINQQKKEDAIPFSLVEAFCSKNPSLAEVVISKKKEKIKEKVKTEEDETEENDEGKVSVRLKANKTEVAKALLDCIDIRLFGATFAMKGTEKKDNVSISIHGPVQITHGVNLWYENNFYSEQIMSPFRNPNEKSEDNTATTLGRQTKLHEGHYLHHFSVNPKNLEDVVSLAGKDSKNLLADDIAKLKEALQKGVTYYDSAAKAGCENELLIWVTLKVDSKLVLPNFTQLMKMSKEKSDGKVQLDLSELKAVTDRNSLDIESVEIYLNKASIVVTNEPQIAVIKDI